MKRINPRIVALTLIAVAPLAYAIPDAEGIVVIIVGSVVVHGHSPRERHRCHARPDPAIIAAAILPTRCLAIPA